MPKLLSCDSFEFVVEVFVVPNGEGGGGEPARGRSCEEEAPRPGERQSTEYPCVPTSANSGYRRKFASL